MDAPAQPLDLWVYGERLRATTRLPLHAKRQPPVFAPVRLAVPPCASRRAGGAGGVRAAAQRRFRDQDTGRRPASAGTEHHDGRPAGWHADVGAADPAPAGGGAGDRALPERVTIAWQRILRWGAGDRTVPR